MSFWKGKRVLITGHTGFKGSWLSILLHELGASVTGIALENDDPKHIYNSAGVGSLIRHHICNINDHQKLNKIIKADAPQIVFHMAAQPLVVQSYLDPIETIETNVLGTTKLLQCCKSVDTVKAIVVVTSDKCYENTGKLKGYSELDPMGGRDPYSASKGACELVSRSIAYSSFVETKTTISTARAGNVIGGGDFAENRLIPDVIRAHLNDETLELRNPEAVRPWQHALEPLFGYLILAESLYEKKSGWGGGWNFGPPYSSAINVGEILRLICEITVLKFKIKIAKQEQFHEERFLYVDSSKSKNELNFSNVWDIQTTLEKTIQWYSSLENGDDMLAVTRKQIQEYLSDQQRGLAE